MLLDRGFAEEIHAALVDDQNHPHRGRDKKPFALVEDIALLLGTIFDASLLEEEGVRYQPASHGFQNPISRQTKYLAVARQRFA